MKKYTNIMWGVIFIIIGIIIGLNALGLTSINLFFDGWWTLIIIIPCFINLFKDEDKMGSIIGILIGLVLLLCQQGLFDFQTVWKLIVPAILVLIGLSFIFKDVFKGKVTEEIKKLNENRIKDGGYCSTFSGQTIKFDDEEFKGTDLNAIFGSITLDLKNSKINEDVVINASCIFGGITIYVPDNVRVKVKSSSIFGGVDEKRKNNSDEKEFTVYLNGSCVFGGINIK